MKRSASIALAVTFLLAAGAAAQAAPLVGELGLLDLTKDYGAGAGNNPATGAPWAYGDAYHLTYITSTARDATSTDIADYNAFVQTDATNEGMGSVAWYAMGSTATVDAKDNAVITGPVFNVYLSEYTAEDAADFWDLAWPGSSPTQLNGDNKNVHTGTGGGGTAHAGLELGASGGSVRIAWTGWTDWVSAWRGEPTSDNRELVGISEELNLLPEPATLALLGLGGLATLIRRRRR